MHSSPGMGHSDGAAGLGGSPTVVILQTMSPIDSPGSLFSELWYSYSYMLSCQDLHTPVILDIIRDQHVGISCHKPRNTWEVETKERSEGIGS